ncbi:hypothetical protein H0H87_007130, partial [Tephrocybe sp. NHM501043]
MPCAPDISSDDLFFYPGNLHNNSDSKDGSYQSKETGEDTGEDTEDESDEDTEQEDGTEEEVTVGGNVEEVDDDSDDNPMPSLRHLPSTSDSAHIKQLEAHVADLEDLLAHSEAVWKLAEGQCHSAETHACHAMREAATLCFQLNQQAEKKDGHGRQINVKARIMTSEEGLQMCQEERAVREEKEWQKQEKQSRKDMLNKENLVRWANHSVTMVFTGALTINGKNKAELGDIVAALGLDMQIDNKQTKAQLFELITQKFEEKPELKNDARFSGMFK